MKRLNENLSIDQANDIVKDKLNWNDIKDMLTNFLYTVEEPLFTIWSASLNPVSLVTQHDIDAINKQSRLKEPGGISFIRVNIRGEKDPSISNGEIIERLENHLPEIMDSDFSDMRFEGSRDGENVTISVMDDEKNLISISFMVSGDKFSMKDFYTVHPSGKELPENCLDDFHEFIARHKLSTGAISDFASFIKKHC